MPAAVRLQPRKRGRPPGRRSVRREGYSRRGRQGGAARVLGLGACVLSAPTTCRMVAGGSGGAPRRANEPNPVKDTATGVLEFKKTHQDAWAETRAAFTSEQWETISMGMELAPSYIV